MNRIAVMTSGGDAPGMNPAIHAIVRTATKAGVEVIGVRRGFAGLLADDMETLDDYAISGMGRRGGTFLQSTRCREFRDAAGQDRGAEVLRGRGIGGLIVIGGDGSLTGALRLHERGFPTLGLPGTIDNDIGGTDMGIGVDTALNTIMGLIDMIKDTASSHERCFIVEVMGRRCGFLAVMSTIATQSHVAVIPEFPMNVDRIVRVIERRFSNRFKNTVIVLAEGACSAQQLADEIVRAKEGIVPNDIRSTVLGHLQRGGAPSNFDRLLASDLGQFAVRALLDGESGKMAGKIAGDPVLTDLESVITKKPDLRPWLRKASANLGIEFGDVEAEAELRLAGGGR